jgi:hypothetical protein
MIYAASLLSFQIVVLFNSNHVVAMLSDLCLNFVVSVFGLTYLQFRIVLVFRTLYSAPACAINNSQRCNNLMTSVLHYNKSRSILDILSWGVIDLIK